MRVLVVQNGVKRTEKLENVHFALKQARSQLAGQPADLIVFGEMFCCAYSPQSFVASAEEVGDIGTRPAYQKNSVAHALSAFAQEQQVLVIGGSIPEKKGDAIYNTCLFFDMEGNIVGKYRKLHMFDVDLRSPSQTQTDSVKSGLRFQESEVIRRGDLGPCWVDCGPFGKIGVGICFDMRFPELSLALTQESGGLSVLVYPAAFSMSTGESHLKLLARARALDSQAFVIVCSPARSLAAKDFQVYGHSMVVSPWGEVLKELDEGVGVIDLEIPVEQAEEARRKIPLKRRFAVAEIKTDFK